MQPRRIVTVPPEADGGDCVLCASIDARYADTGRVTRGRPVAYHLAVTPTLTVQEIKCTEECLQSGALPPTLYDAEDRGMSPCIAICLVSAHVNRSEEREKSLVLVELELDDDPDTTLAKL